MKRSGFKRKENQPSMARDSGKRRSARSTLKVRHDPLLAAWSRRVKKRDKICQWLNCEFCWNREDALLDPHHKAPRSLRPDLRLDDSNGVTVCRRRHEWLTGAGRDEAIAKGFLNLQTYEAARKNAA